MLLFFPHSPVIARAGSVGDALRHLEFKFGRSTWGVVSSSCTSQRQSFLAIFSRLVQLPPAR